MRIDVKPRELRERGLAFTDVNATLAPLFVAGDGVARTSLAELEALPVRNSPPDRPPVRLGDVALVRLTEDMQTGLADLGGVRAVGGIVIARRNADIAALVEAVKQTIARECRKLPHRAADPARLDSGAAADIHVVTTYDRSELATRVRATLLRALGEEVGVVVLVLLVFLLSIRERAGPARDPAGRPAAHLRRDVDPGRPGHHHEPGRHRDRARHGRRRRHRGARGLAPAPGDGRPAASADDRRAKLLAAAQAFAPAILTSLLITALSFLPVLAFTGETGRLLRPLAITKTIVVIAAALVTLTLAPALRDRLLRGRVVPEFDNPLTRTLVRLYRPVRALRAPAAGAHAGDGRAGARLGAADRRRAWAASSCRASTRAICSTCRPPSPACRPSRRRSSSTGRTTP